MNMLFTGPISDFFESGKIQSRGYRKNGMLEGLFEEFYENGNLKHFCTYKSNKPEGLYKDYYVNGKVEVQGNCQEGIKRGLWQIFSEDGSLIWEGDIEIHFYESGYMKASGLYLNSQKNGYWEYYRDNDTRWGEKTVKISDQKKWKIHCRGNYQSGKKIGLWEYFDEFCGALIQRVNFDDDKLHGIEEQFNENGQIKKLTTYKRGIRHGIYQEFLPDYGDWINWEDALEEKQDISSNLNKAYDAWQYEVFLRCYGTYLEGKKEGYWTYFNEKQEPVFIEQYKEDKLIAEQGDPGEIFDFPEDDKT